MSSTEDRVAKPTDSYGRSKLKGEYAVREALAGSDTRLVILRPVLMYGAGAKGNMGTLMKLARLPLPLPLGGFTARRSLLGVDNFADAVRHALLEPRAAGGTFLLADNEPLPIAEIIGALRQGLSRRPGMFHVSTLGAEAALRRFDRADLAARIFGDLIVTTGAIAKTGWFAPLTVRAGLAAAMKGARG